MSKLDVAFIGGRGFLSNYGGVENATREIASELARSYDVSLAVYGVCAAAEAHAGHTPSVSVISCPAWIYRLFGQHAMIFYCIMHAVLITRPKVVVLFASGPCVFTPLLRMFGLNVVTSLRAVDSGRDKWGAVSRTILKFGEYCSWRYSNKFTVNSKEMVDIFKPYRSDVLYIPNGAKSKLTADSDILQKLNVEGGRYFLFAARLDPVKRLHLLLEAYQLMDVSTRIPLVVAGGNVKDPAYLSRLQELAGPEIIFAGHLGQQELEVLLKSSRAFISPSVLEGMSNSILSAMANAKPVLAANVKANADVLQVEEAMFEADDIQHLATKLTAFAVNPKYCIELGERLKLVADQNFTWPGTAKKFYQSFECYL